MTATGGGYSDAGQHSQTLHATFAHMPGLKVAVPSNAYDAKGLMISAIRDDSPVLYMFHKGLQGLAWMASPEKAAVDALHCGVAETAYVLPPTLLVGQPLDIRRGPVSMNFWLSSRKCLPSSAIISNR